MTPQRLKDKYPKQIKNILDAQHSLDIKEFKEMVKGMFNTDEMNEMEGKRYTEGFNKALTDIIYLLQN